MSDQLTFRVPGFPFYIFSGEDTYQPGRRHASRRNLGVFDLLYVRSGCLYMQENGQKWALSKDHTLILAPNAAHGGYRDCQEPTHFYWLHLQTSGTWYAQDQNQPQLPANPSNLYTGATFELPLPKSQVLADPQAVSIFQQLLALTQAVAPNQRFTEQMLFQQLLQLMLAPTLAAGSQTETVAQAAIAYLNTHYQQPINDATMSAALNYHPGYITRCLKKSKHTTPTAYLIQLRLAQAKRLLISAELPIEAIAQAVGYPNVSYFSRLFKRQVGQTPHAFRNQKNRH